jgi:alpha-mannosidase
MSINILRHALDLMRRDSRYTFTQDQMAAIEPFWNTLTDDDKQFLLKMVKDRRFELATGMYLQPDEAESDFESLVRQFFPALEWMKRTFSTEVSTAWNIDTYGHTIQIPQLFSRSGLKYFVFQRDVLPSLQASIKSPFYWKGPDGSTLLSYWLSGSYSLDWRGMSENLRRFVEHRAPGISDILLLYGGDVYLPNETTSEIESRIRQAASKGNIPVKNIVFCTPSQYFEVIQKTGVSLPTYTNEFNPPLFIQDLRGLYGERPDAKMANRRAEHLLESSEKFSSIASRFGLKYPQSDLQAAWLKVIFNQDHDALPGSHTDPVEEKMASRYGGAIETGRSALFDAMYTISRKVDTSRSPNYPFLVFNPLSTQRTDTVRYTPLFKEQITNFHLLDDAGNEVPFRLNFAGRRELGEPLSMAAIEFAARDIPALGYRLYQLAPQNGNIKFLEDTQASREFSNTFFTVRIDSRTGGIRSIVSRATGEELLNVSKYLGNELVLQEEKDPDMEGMLHFTGTEVRMTAYPASSIKEMRDGLGTRILSEGPFLSGRRSQKIYLYDAIPRIDFQTELQGFPGHDGVLTSVFPIRSGSSTVVNYETHNAVTTRPDGIYYAQTFVDAENAKTGIGFFNRGMGGVETDQGVIRLILLRSITNYKGYYAPNGSEAGSHTFEYSLYYHPGDWHNGVIDQAHSFATPLLTIATDAHAGPLPSHNSFVSVGEGNFEITALKRSEDGASWVLRGHETMGKSGRVVLSLDRPLHDVWLADLVEKPTRAIPFSDRKVSFDCNPFEFVTLRMSAKDE